MMAMAHKGFAFLSMTKTGSTSIEATFSRYAQITTRRPPPMKHMRAATFNRYIVPILESYGYPRSSYELVCIVREPVDWVASWYRYRSREAAQKSSGYTGDMTFEEFVGKLLDEEVSLGSATQFVSARGKRLVDRMYRYEHLGDAVEWMAGKLEIDTPTLKRVNTSPDRDLAVPASLRARLEERYAKDVALYEAAL